jgi:hypothetical protein
MIGRSLIGQGGWSTECLRGHLLQEFAALSTRIRETLTPHEPTLRSKNLPQILGSCAAFVG